MRATFAFVTLLAFLASDLGAQQTQLSPNEQAALSQKQPTSQQADRHRRECGFAPQNTGKIVRISPQVEMRIFTLPSLQFLPIIGMAQHADSDDKFSITRFNDLPNGGIAGMDICGTVQLETFAEPKPGTPIRHIVLRLRENLDIASEYPTTSVEIFRRQQYLRFAAGSYAEVDLGNADVRAWYESFARIWTRRDPLRMGIATNEAVLIPIR